LLASQTYLMYTAEGRAVSWWHLAGWQVTGWYFWAPTTPVILWLGRRIPFTRERWGRALSAHVAFAVVIFVVFAVYSSLITKWIAPAPYSEYPLLQFFGFFFLLRFHLGLLTYGGIAGIGYGLDYARKYRQRELEASELQAQLAQAQLQALRMQLNPHFLFNTLHTISMLVRKNENTDAVRMLAGLSDLLRLALENVGAQEVPLKQELDFLERYLELQQIRFHDRLQVRFDIDSATLDARVPNLILQPLVENAIRHGIATRASAGIVEVKAWLADDKLRVEVRDDGPGPKVGLDVEGVGLSNTRKRLRRLYGDEQRFELRHGEQHGAVAALEIPFRSAHAESPTEKLQP
jgi:sensor histidine kinase YesM